MPDRNLRFKIIFVIGALALVAVGFLLFVLKANNHEENAILSASKKNQNIIELPSSEKRQISILFVGDMMFDRYIREVVEKRGGDYNYPLAPLNDYLASFDLVVANLEGPITDKKSVSVATKMEERNNFIFTFDPKTAEAIAQNNIKLVSLGNNHILNQGEEGLEQTKKYLSEAGLEYFGDTGNEEDAYVSKEIGGIKIGFVNYNYTMAESTEKALENIEMAEKRSDLVFVYPHWGTEYKTGDPGQEIRSLGYRFIDAGADVIIGTHPHVVQNNEKYKGKRIYYSLGNFLFDQYFQKETKEGLGLVLVVKPDLTIEYEEVEFAMKNSGQTELKTKISNPNIQTNTKNQ